MVWERPQGVRAALSSSWVKSRRGPPPVPSASALDDDAATSGSAAPWAAPGRGGGQLEVCALCRRLAAHRRPCMCF